MNTPFSQCPDCCIICGWVDNWPAAMDLTIEGFDDCPCAEYGGTGNSIKFDVSALNGTFSLTGATSEGAGAWGGSLIAPAVTESIYAGSSCAGDPLSSSTANSTPQVSIFPEQIDEVYTGKCILQVVDSGNNYSYRGYVTPANVFDPVDLSPTSCTDTGGEYTPGYGGTAAISFPDGSRRGLVRGPGPVERARWPVWARVLALARRRGDKGIGDVVERIIGRVNSDKFKAWHLRTFGRPCRCQNRKARWNRLYPL